MACEDGDLSAKSGCAQSNTDQVPDRVIGLVKKFDKIDSSNKASVIVHVSLHSKIDICQGLEPG